LKRRTMHLQYIAQRFLRRHDCSLFMHGATTALAVRKCGCHALWKRMLLVRVERPTKMRRKRDVKCPRLNRAARLKLDKIRLRRFLSAQARAQMACVGQALPLFLYSSSHRFSTRRPR
jgi:hypothetical protein